MMKLISKIGAIGALSLVLAIVLVACGGEDPTATPRPAATPTPSDAMMDDTAEPTPTPADAMTGDAPTAAPDTGGSTGPAPTPTPVPRPTATPLPVDPGFDAESYFKGRTIRIMVGFNPGGGTDAQARFMSRAWSEYIPGNPRLVVTNMTPVITQRNFVWNSEPDGFTIAVEATPGIFDQVTPQAQFDMRDVSMIGVTSGKDAFWVTHHSTPYECLETAINGPVTLTIGTSAPTPADLGSTVMIPYMADQFNVPLEIKNVAAAGSAEQYLMLERGDVNSWTSSTVWYQLPVTRPGWTRDRFIKPFIDMSFPGYILGPNAEGPFDCPNVNDLLPDDQKPVWLAMNAPRTYASKNIIGPPGIPAGPLTALRDALGGAMADPGFAASMEKFTGIPNNFTHGEVAQQELYDATQQFLDNRALIGEIQEAMYAKYVR